MNRAQAKCLKCNEHLKGHMGKHREICPSTHKHLKTSDNKYTCSFEGCNITFTTLHSAHKHSTTICPKNKDYIAKFPCPNGCEQIFTNIKNAKIHAKSRACSKNSNYNEIIYREIKDEMTYCRGCRKDKNVSLFGKCDKSPTKLAYNCYKCIAIHAMFQSCKKRAKKENRIVDFTLNDIKLLAEIDTCPVFGFSLQYGGKKSAVNSATIDAFIHKEGHQKENLRIISRRANTIKNNATVDDMKLLMDAMKSWKPANIIDMPKIKRRHIILQKDQLTKICSVCKIDKPINEYSKDSKSTLGISCRCYRCSALKAMLNNAKNRVIKKGIPFTITLNNLHSLAKDNNMCLILNIPLQYAGGNLCDNSATLDRFDPIKGYIPNNVWIISDKANRMKSDANIEDIEKVYNYMISS